jgi:glycosyltransferase involved in cell wall biosynthesis
MSKAIPSKLAIIIPAFKTKYLEESIKSILNQTNQEYNLYVFDDASPENVLSIFKTLCENRTNCFYHRFELNLGSQDLAQHWNRCVLATKDEDWIWLFSDDDIMSPDCVERFMVSVNSCYQTLYRFNTKIIDDHGQTIAWNPPHPHEESVEDFLYHRLKNQRQSFVVEYIFSRDVFKNKLGFISLPDAWGSDDLSWVRFAGKNPIITIDSSYVSWRYSATNLAGRSRSRNKIKFMATIQYIKLINAMARTGEIFLKRHTQADFDLLLQNYYWHTLQCRMPISISDCAYLIKNSSEINVSISKSRVIKKLLLIYINWISAGLNRHA